MKMRSMTEPLRFHDDARAELEQSFGLAAFRPGRSRVKINELRSWTETRPELRPESRFMPDVATPADIAQIAPPLATVTQ